MDCSEKYVVSKTCAPDSQKKYLRSRASSNLVWASLFEKYFPCRTLPATTSPTRSNKTKQDVA